MNAGERTCTQQITRISWENLMNFGALTLTFADESDYDALEQGDLLALSGVPETLWDGSELTLENRTRGTELIVRPRVSGRRVNVLLGGGIINWMRERLIEQEG